MDLVVYCFDSASNFFDKYHVQYDLVFMDIEMPSVGKAFVGDVNSSGHTVDTYVFDDFSVPAMQNFGDFRYKYNGEEVGCYINYAEGIYVGYRYYETRYADAFNNVDNVGTYDYASTVNLSITVKNTGSVAGKTPIEVYYQSEYIDYYNNRRIKGKTKWMPPAKYREASMSAL
ncbi:MAG: hypothetical protein K6B65_06120 [Bacilli bacterium]|nr:hypothetical protein [Bacilli bacterium]